MDQERVTRLARELGDADLAERLVSARGAVVGPVPDDVARRHLRAVTLVAGTAAAGAASVTTVSSAAATTGVGAAASVGGVAAGGTVLGAVGGFKIGVAAFATAIATAGGLGATGHLPEPVQRIVDDVAGRTDIGGPGDEGGGPVPADAPPTEADVHGETGPSEDTGRRERERAERADEVARDDAATDAPEGTPPRGRDDVGVGSPDEAPAPGTDGAAPGDMPAGPPDGPSGGRDTSRDPRAGDGPSDDVGTPMIGDDGAPGDAGDAPNRQHDAPGRPAEPGAGAPDSEVPGRSGSAPSAPPAPPAPPAPQGPTPTGSGKDADKREARQNGAHVTADPGPETAPGR